MLKAFVLILLFTHAYSHTFIFSYIFSSTIAKHYFAYGDLKAYTTNATFNIIYIYIYNLFAKFVTFLPHPNYS